jgi:hypothetical protein
MDLIFHCQVCQGPLVASDHDCGIVYDCPHCGSSQVIPVEADFGKPASAVFNEDTYSACTPDPNGDTLRFTLKRVYLRRTPGGELIRAALPSSPTAPRKESAAISPAPLASEHELQSLRQEISTLREKLSEQDPKLQEWQTCYESVEREIAKASERRAALQARYAAAANDLAQTRHELAKVRAEADGLRKANEALTRQLQAMIRARPGPASASVPSPEAKKKAVNTKGKTRKPDGIAA